MKGYNKVGEGKYEVYKKKKTSVWEVIGGIIFVLFIIGAASE